MAASLAAMSFCAACDSTRGPLRAAAAQYGTVCGQYNSMTRRATSLAGITAGASPPGPVRSAVTSTSASSVASL